ncbi:hypothetical protein CTAM01_15878 [Colletotrichum tamarilloi]|uniref:Uncharacterized protein n=2 Tax=Colletotrichum acutatum species complex TaxID=2707335 RepID=A0ABQ9PH36_9PEZI|nr:uncharacterized protein CTAM01_15878 [Colletotrichum tamarilloi]KAK0371362.1 hypothetical protein CLIM01_11294 [Colletotrichum limetticola]KAK1474521.1 hypothetical protein CTAM01_15878 [Colletotrichum tamarilloi]
MKTTTTKVVLLTLLSSSGFVTCARAAANLCFFPGGVQSLDVPCDPKAEVSMCCGSVNACLSNGLCKLEDTSNNTGIAYARGTCSDPTWQSPICPQHCVLNPDTRKNNTAYDFRFNGVQVWQCDSQGFGVPGKFCCESAAEKTRCCSTPPAIFGPLIAATPGNAVAVQTLNTGAKSTPTPSGSGRAGVTGGSNYPSQQTPEMTAVPTMTSKIPATPGGAEASQPTADTNTGSSGDSGQKGIGNVAVVGLGVGASVGGALLVAVGVMWYLRKERSRQGPVELDGSSINGGYGGSSGASDLSRSNTGHTGRIAYGGMNIHNMNQNGGTGTISSMGTGTYNMSATPGMMTVRKASSEWDGSPGGLGGNYQMAEIDGKEAIVVAEPQGRKKSLYELP